MRPGTSVLTVTPSAATSPDRVLPYVTSEARNVFDIARIGTGWMTPEEVTVNTRPQPRCLICGTMASVIRNDTQHHGFELAAP